MRAARKFAQRGLGAFGFRLQHTQADAAQRSFGANASAIVRRHRHQTRSDVADLNEKYADPIFGEVHVADLFPILARCIDPTDRRLGCASQLTHVLQVIEGMRADGITDRDLLLAALVHDLGKVLLLTKEDPANVACVNEPIGEFEAGSGFDNCVFQWNHDEFGYSRLREHVPDVVAWLTRYHSVRMDLPEVQRLMDHRDRDYAERYFTPFRKYDFGTKSVASLPNTQIEDYRALLDEAFPKPIPF